MIIRADHPKVQKENIELRMYDTYSRGGRKTNYRHIITNYLEEGCGWVESLTFHIFFFRTLQIEPTLTLLNSATFSQEDKEFTIRVCAYNLL